MTKVEEKIQLAPQNQLRFTSEALENLLLRLLGHPEALITDLSSLRDFCSFDADEAEEPGSLPGYYIFKSQVFKKGVKFFSKEERNNRENWEERTFEVRAVPFKKCFVRKVFRHTGVDISPVFEKKLPVILNYIARNMPENKRQKYFARMSL